MGIREHFSRLRKRLKERLPLGRDGKALLEELEALEVCDRQSLVSLYLNSFSVRYLRGIHSPLSIPAHV